MEPNFVLVPDADPLSYLWRAFPDLQSELDDGDSECYYIYARFADLLASNHDDDQLWNRSYAFFESLAAGGGTLQDVLVIGVFEPLCEAPMLAARLKGNLGPRALTLFEDMRAH